jgi:hypothetical protein
MLRGFTEKLFNALMTRDILVSVDSQETTRLSRLGSPTLDSEYELFPHQSYFEYQSSTFFHSGPGLCNFPHAFYEDAMVSKQQNSL